MDCEAEALRDLVHIGVHAVAAVAFDPVGDFLEEPAELAQLTDQLVRRWRDRNLRYQHVRIFK